MTILGCEMKSARAEAEYRIVSDEAVVVSGHVLCWKCQASIEVVCLYCQSGFVDGEAALDFSVSNLTAVDEILLRQLAPWPHFRRVQSSDGRAATFENHCPSCAEAQDDWRLHHQPGSIFFCFQDPAYDLKIYALQGRVRFSGDEGFGL